MKQRFMEDRDDAVPEANGVRNLSDGEFPAQLDDRVHGNRHGQSEPQAPVAEAPKPRRVSSTSSEPVLERVVVSPHATPEGTAPSAEGDAAKPSRKGWWQRKLGLE